MWYTFSNKIWKYTYFFIIYIYIHVWGNLAKIYHLYMLGTRERDESAAWQRGNVEPHTGCVGPARSLVRNRVGPALWLCACTMHRETGLAHPQSRRTEERNRFGPTGPNCGASLVMRKSSAWPRPVSCARFAGSGWWRSVPPTTVLPQTRPTMPPRYHISRMHDRSDPRSCASDMRLILVPAFLACGLGIFL